jgi:hypothetical protein
MLAYEWYTSPMIVEIPEGNLTREDLLTLSRPPTYEEIMSVIAEYPGPDEPLYKPAPDEAIWLTDLEGHVDIYDNDSIVINYADWFDKSQVTKIEIYRNGIKMRFLPDTFGVLTNEHMKTFDGNPLEHTPASSHTDHAIFGYEYSFRFNTRTNTSSQVSATVKSGVRHGEENVWAYIGLTWEVALREWKLTDHQIIAFYEQLKDLGFHGVQIGVMWFIDGMTANSIMPQYTFDPVVHSWAVTQTDTELRRVLRLAREVGLGTYLRLELWATDRSQAPEAYVRHEIQPQNISLLFENYGDIAVHYAQIAEEEHVEIYCPIVEMNSLDQYADRVEALLTRIDLYFSGQLAVNASIHHYLLGFNCYNDESRFERNVGKYYDWVDDLGRPLRIDMSCWSPPLEVQSDQRFSFMLESMVQFWSSAVEYFRSTYAASPIAFGEIGAYNYDGMGANLDDSPYPNKPGLVRDDQEFADIWAAYLIAAKALGLDGVAAWSVHLHEFWRIVPGSGSLMFEESPLNTVIREYLSKS